MSNKVSFLMGKMQTALGFDQLKMKDKFPDPDYDRGITFVKDAALAIAVERFFRSRETAVSLGS